MTEQEKKFIHFVSCIESLNNAWVIIKTIKEQIDNPLVGPAFRFALIEYSKPYKQSFGSKKRKLGTSCVPDEMIELHKRIIDARDQIHAHRDLTVMEARVYTHEVEGRRISCIVQNKITGLEEFTNIDEIQMLIEGTLNNMYEKEKLLEAALP